SVIDGAGAGTYAQLPQVFRDFSNVYLELRISGQTLSPRLPVLSAAYSLNADQVDGLDSTQLARLGSSNTFTAAQTLQSGLVLGGSFSMAAGAAAGKVLTSNAAGTGTWQAASGLTLPYSGTDASSAEAFRVDSTSSGGIALTGTTSSDSGFGI